MRSIEYALAASNEIIFPLNSGVARCLPPLTIRIDQLSYKEEQEFPTKQTVLIYKKVYNNYHIYRVI
jgi:hypothetical protein